MDIPIEPTSRSTWIGRVLSRLTSTVANEGALPTPLDFPWEPLDDGPLLERHEWLTVVNVAQEDSERRAQIRATARTSLRFEVIPKGKEQGTLDAQVWKHIPQQWKLPWWPDQGVLTATTTNSRWINVDTTGRRFVVGEEFILYNDWANYVVLPVLEVEATRVRFLATNTSPHSGLYKAGVARAIPLRVALLAPSRSIDRETYNGRCMTWSSWLSPQSPVTAVALTQYRGRDLLTMDHNAREVMEEQLSWTTDRMDTGSGVFRNRTPSLTPVSLSKLLLVRAIARRNQHLERLPRMPGRDGGWASGCRRSTTIYH